eukprot:m.39009 g.39009  ORF g.39009 m.39009 type:complete len:994 (-) comp10277_c1_seq1:366-3347(-)
MATHSPHGGDVGGQSSPESMHSTPQTVAAALEVRVQPGEIPKKHKSLHRLVFSEMFTVSMAIQYLSDYTDPYVLKILVERMYTFPIRQIEVYLPQLLLIFVKEPITHARLQQLFCALASTDMHFALLLVWLLQAELENLALAKPKQQAALTLLDDILSTRLNVPSTHARAQVRGDQQIAGSDPIQNGTQLKSALAAELKFVQSLMDIGERLRRFPTKDARRGRLFGELAMLNLTLPSRVYLPLAPKPEYLRAVAPAPASATPTPSPTRDSFSQSIPTTSTATEQSPQLGQDKLGAASAPSDQPSQPKTPSTRGTASQKTQPSDGFKSKSSRTQSCDCSEARQSPQHEPTDEDIAPSTPTTPHQASLCTSPVSLATPGSGPGKSIDNVCSHHVVRVPPEEALVLNSKDKAPYMIHVEIVETDDFYGAQVPSKQGVARTRPRQPQKGHRRSHSAQSHLAMHTSPSMTAKHLHRNPVIASTSALSSTSTGVPTSSSDHDLHRLGQSPEGQIAPTPPHSAHSRLGSQYSAFSSFPASTAQESTCTEFLSPRVSVSERASRRDSPHSVSQPLKPVEAIVLEGSSSQTMPVTAGDGTDMADIGRATAQSVHVDQLAGALEQVQVHVAGDEDDDEDGEDVDQEDAECAVSVDGISGGVDSDLSASVSVDDQSDEGHEPEKRLSATAIRQRLSDAAATPESQFEKGHSDSAAVKAKENWTEKVARIRQLSPYGHLRSWRLVPVIIKSGDDLRQELLATQLLEMFQQVWYKEQVGLWIRPLKILVTSADGGMLEVVGGAVSLHQTKKNASDTLAEYFEQQFSDADSPEKLYQARVNFTQSLAAYSLFTYFAQVKDRHNGNVLIDSEGHLIHIDFGFFLSNSPGRNMGFETAPFKFNSDFVQVMGGLDSDLFRYFKSLVFRGFLIARKYMDDFVTIIRVMAKDSGLPCFVGGEEAVKQFETRFQRSLTDEQLKEHVELLIAISLDNRRTRLYDNFQYFTNGIL